MNENFSKISFRDHNIQFDIQDEVDDNEVDDKKKDDKEKEIDDRDKGEILKDKRKKKESDE